MFVWRHTIWVMYLVGGRRGNAYFRWFQHSKGNCDSAQCRVSLRSPSRLKQLVGPCCTNPPWRFQGWRWLPFKNCWFYPSMSTCWSNKRSLTTSFSIPSFVLGDLRILVIPQDANPKGAWYHSLNQVPGKPSAAWNLRQRLAAGCQGDGWKWDVDWLDFWPKIRVNLGMSQVNEIFFPKNMCDTLPKTGRVGCTGTARKSQCGSLPHPHIWCRYSTIAWLKLMQVESEAKPECGKPNDP